MCSYMMELQNHFYGFVPPDEPSDKLQKELGAQLNDKQRIMLLHLVDEKDRHCNEVALENFIAGFRLAVGIAADLNAGKETD